MRILWIIGLLGLFALPLYATDLFFDPDTLIGEVGNTVTLSGRITGSVLMRSYTVYIAYDTNVIDLNAAPVAGALIAGRPGLQFNYFDHAPIHPDLLEVTATVFGSSFWQGPGELFRLTFALRACADAPLTAPFAPLFIDSNNGFPTVTFVPAIAGVCGRVPQSPLHLVINYGSGPSVDLHWQAVIEDTLSRPLWSEPIYQLFGQPILPVIGAPILLVSTVDTFATHTFTAGDVSWNYFVKAATP